MLRVIFLSLVLLVSLSLANPNRSTVYAASVAQKTQNLITALGLMFSDFTDYKEDLKSNFTFGFLESSACNTQDKYSILAKQRGILDFIIQHYRGISEKQLQGLLNSYNKYESELVFLEQADTVNRFAIEEDAEKKAALQAEVRGKMLTDTKLTSSTLIQQNFEDFFKYYRKRFDKNARQLGEYATCQGPYHEVQLKFNRLRELVKFSITSKSLQSKWKVLNRQFDNIKGNASRHYQEIYNKDMKLLKNFIDPKQSFQAASKEIFDYQKVLDRFKEKQINKSKTLQQGLIVKSEEAQFQKTLEAGSQTQFDQNLVRNYQLFDLPKKVAQLQKESSAKSDFTKEKSQRSKELFYKGSLALESLIQYKEAGAYVRQIDRVIKESNQIIGQVIKKQCRPS